MFNRISVNLILKVVIGTLGTAVVVMLAVGAWNSWTRLKVADRIAAVVDISGDLFTTQHNLRVDRSTTLRAMNGDAQLQSLTRQTQEVRAAEIPALKSALASLEKLDWPEKQITYPALAEGLKKLLELNVETEAAVKLPKASRRQGLAQEHFKVAGDLLHSIDIVTAQLTRLVSRNDAYVDQLLIIK